ncbi:MAG: ECF-type sigma factor [Thermoguttaceae bacterium]
MTEVTRILSQIEQGDPTAAGDLLPLVYHELRRLAAARLARERGGKSLQPTELVHEAYLRLVSPECSSHWNGRGHFFAAAAEAMRRILVDRARRRRRLRHGGGRGQVELGDYAAEAPADADSLLALDEALTRLAAEDSQKAELVKLRYFAGFTIDEAAELLGISPATAKRHWAYSRAWLFAEIRDGA